MPQPPAGLRPCVAPPGRRPRPAPAGHAGRQTADTDEVERKLGAWHSEESGAIDASGHGGEVEIRSEEHTSELQSLMRISYAVFCLKKKKKTTHIVHESNINTQ